MDHIFRVMAIVLACIAVYLYWVGSSDGLYFAIVLACVAFFLGIRVQVKRRNDERQGSTLADQDKTSG
ncbi:hypothetical protein [Leptolyngbya sp. 7M]|uniref:hypothetical protein n=1 Tax=Leptolyngbya sp. 7M TaxID=2812896 RepID=UPI001B8AE34C|nr:hypothetical protein [Leptolyngbya sp. 7M]QYO65966.1 hypothetical protein JVX88_03970 [Leptolyngbya sp. 7M]